MTTSTRGKPHRKMKTGVFDAAMASHRGVFVSFCLRTRFLDMKREISIFLDEKLEKSIFSFFISKNLDSSFHVSKPSASKNSRKPRSALPAASKTPNFFRPFRPPVGRLREGTVRVPRVLGRACSPGVTQFLKNDRWPDRTGDGMTRVSHSSQNGGLMVGIYPPDFLDVSKGIY